MLALLPRSAVPAPFLPDDEAAGAGGTSPSRPTLARLAARASLPTPRLVCLGPPEDEEGGGGGGGGADDDDAMDPEAGTAGLHTHHASSPSPHPGVAVAPGAAHAAHATLAGAAVAVALAGGITNAAEVAALYGAELSSDGEEEEGTGGVRAPAGAGTGAAAATDLLLDAFMRGFADECGDGSDQPSTFLASLKGGWAAVVVARGEDGGGGGGGGDGNGGCHVIIARGRGPSPPTAAEGAGEEDEDEDDDDDGGLGPPPLFWGVVDGAVVVATTPALSPGQAGGTAATLSPFPAGCVFESGRPGAPGAPPSLSDFTRPSPAARRVTPLPKRDSRGRLCGFAYHSKSGRDLASAGGGGVGGGGGSEAMAE
jgi:hypothetical protein